MTKRAAKKSEEEVSLLVTVAEDSLPRLEQIVSELQALGMEQREVFRLGGVIAGTARPSDLARIRTVPGVLSLEIDQTFTAD